MFNVSNSLGYCFLGSQHIIAASVRTTVRLAKRIKIESLNLTFPSLKSQLLSTKKVD